MSDDTELERDREVIAAAEAAESVIAGDNPIKYVDAVEELERRAFARFPVLVAALAALRDELTASQAREAKWIAVGERMPDVGKRFLTLMKSGLVSIAELDRHIHPHNRNWDDWCLTREVTHWQPLPAPPKL